MRRIASTTIHNDITAPALSQRFLIEDFRHSSILVLAVGATTTIKVKVSNVENNIIDFSAPSTVTNPWYYVDLKGLGDGASTVVGTTGLALTASTSQRGYAINIDMAKWVAVDVEALSLGSVSVILSRATND
jgi:hypothetical protein